MQSDSNPSVETKRKQKSDMELIKLFGKAFGYGWNGMPVDTNRNDMSPAQESQFDRLRAEICPDREGNFKVMDPSTNEFVPIRRHGLVKVKSRRMADLFRLKYWWRCWFCDLCEEVVDCD